MGRVYNALRRASAEEFNNAHRQSRVSSFDRESQVYGVIPSDGAGHAVNSSAFTAHTANSSVGTALPAGKTSRAAGATLDAVRPARAIGLVSYDVSPARVEPRLVAITQPRSAYCEQFRSLRTRVLQAGEREGMQTLVVTSAGIGEGKTMTALNLAWLLAQTEGVRALVIDSDLRQPCATDYLALDAPRGLSEVLGGELHLCDAIVRVDPAGLYLLPGGEPRDEVAEMLSGPTYARVIAEVRRMFDYIIIDAPPLGIFTDANVLINRADRALMVVRSGKTRYTLVEKLLQTLPRERLLGVVLNRADEELEPASYYYQQRHYRNQRMLPEQEPIQLVDEIDEEVAIAS